MLIDLAIVQMDIALGQPCKNAERVQQLTANLERADLVLLPELWSTGYALDRAAELAEDIGDSPSVMAMADVARRLGAFVGGSMLIKRAGQVYNSFVLVNPSGEIDCQYDKLHLFGLMQEDLHLAAGERLAQTNLGFANAGLAICYDLRFPEIFRKYADSEVEMLLLCAEWPHPRLHHWRTLLLARAIENQAYVIASNRVGNDKNNRFFGHSLVIDPWGEIVAEGGEEEAVIICQIDLAAVSSARSRLTALSDRRRELF